MSKGGKQQTVTTPDSTAQQRQAAVWNAAQQAGRGPAPLGAQQAGNFYTNGMNFGSMGLSALGGNAAAAQGLLNPFMSNVVDATRNDWQNTDAATANQLASMATQAGAFGGSRYGVALGQALADNNRQEQDQLANLRYGGFNDAMARAGQLAGFGFGGAQGAMGTIPYLDPRYRQFALDQSAIGSAPGGTSQVTTGKNGRNVAGGVLGGAATGATIGSVIPGLGTTVGGILGGGIGLLGSLF